MGYGRKFKYKGELYMEVDSTPRTIKARRIFDIDSKYNPFGSVANVVTTIKRKKK